MKYQRILDILDQVSLPRLSRDELLAIAQGSDSTRFKNALLQVESGEHQQASVLRTVIDQLRLAPAGEHQAIMANATKHKQVDRQAAPPYFSFKIYGGSAALCISEARVRATNAPTVQIESAAALGKNTFGWQDKIIIQLSTQELLQATALFERKISFLEFKGHGRLHDKLLRLEVQEGKILVQLAQRGVRMDSVPVPPAEAFGFISLAYKQIHAGAPHLDMTMIRSMVDQVAVSSSPAPR